MLRPLLTLALMALALAAPRPAQAYTYDSPVSEGCHEQLAAEALRRARELAPGARPVSADANDSALIDDLTFELPADMRDLGGATLLLAVRDNDLKGRHPTNTTDLALIHGDPALQREHCLRHPSQDEPEGSALALADCAAFLRERVDAALDGLDEHGDPDAQDRVPFRVHLAIRREVTALLPRYWVRIGQALHALQDGFTHTLRTPDHLRVRVVLNWVDQIEGRLDERRDGPPHMQGMDACDATDPLRAGRLEVARRASIELLEATLAPGLDREGRRAAVAAVVDRYFTFEPGCSFDNGWCDAPELAFRDAAACACRAGHAPPSRGALASSVVLVAAVAMRRTRRRRS